MRNKKFVITVFVLLAVLFLGIGYAAASEQLNVDGKINTIGGDFDVNFVNPEVDAANTSEGVTAGKLNANNNTFDIQINNLRTVGDKITIKVEVENTSSDFNAKISEFSVTKPTVKYFDVEVIGIENDQVIAPNGKVTITITVELLFASIDATSGEFRVQFKANPVELEPTPAA